MNAVCAIEAEGIFFGYSRGAPVLNGLTMRAARGEFLCILGHSGCGKSTLLNVLAGLTKQWRGSLKINGEESSGPGTDRAVVFQDYSLFPWMTALGNVAFGIRHSKKLPKSEAERLASDYLASVGLSESAEKYPHQLSGGMKQRAAIARALAMDSSVWLFDEPFSALDPQMRRSLQMLVTKLAKSEPARTVVFVTHNVDEAVMLGDRILFMDGGRICSDIAVPFAHPRRPEKITQTPEYFSIVSSLAQRFYEVKSAERA